MLHVEDAARIHAKIQNVAAKLAQRSSILKQLTLDGY